MKHALIIGSGIAGPVTAIALQRAGIDSVVYEAHADSAGEGGLWLTVAVNGLDALRRLDLHEPVLACGFPTATMRLRSGTGKLLAEVPIGGTLADGTVTHTLRRSDLYRALQGEAQRRGIRFAHGKRLVAAEVDGDGVLARFADGSEARGDLLIGADGIHSRVRQILDADAPGQRYGGMGNFGGYAPGDAADGAELPPGVVEMMFGRRCFFGMTRAPSGEIWWFANPPRRSPIDRAELATTTSAQWRAQLIELFAGDAGPAAQIVRASRDPVVGANQYDMPRVPVWSRGPMVIVGDAAHAVGPSSGQGASMAIEDSLVLAGCLRDAPSITRALADYEHIRRGRVERVVAYGARSGNTKLAGPVGRVVRDLVLPWILPRVTRPAQMAWLFEHRVEF